jgi:hypothetical protein
MNIIAALLALQGIIDAETLGLFVRFIERAKSQPDTNAWLKQQLKLVLDETVVIVDSKRR